MERWLPRARFRSALGTRPVPGARRSAAAPRCPGV